MKTKKSVQNVSQARRSFVKRAAYVAPVILTLPAAPAFARAGSERTELRRPPGMMKPTPIDP